MKNLYLKLLFIITSFIATEAWATTEETVIDGITYEITYYQNDYSDLIAYVVKPQNDSYKGDITIPDSIKYGGKYHKLTGIKSSAFKNSRINNLFLEFIENKDFDAEDYEYVYLYYLNKDCILYVHGRDYQKAKKEFPGIIKTFEDYYVDNQTKTLLGEVSFTITVPIIKASDSSPKISTKKVNNTTDLNERKLDVTVSVNGATISPDQNGVYTVGNLMPGADYKVIFNWAKTENGQIVDKGTVTDSIKTMKPTIKIENKIENLYSISFVLNASSDNSITPSEVGARIYDYRTDKYLEGNYTASNGNIIEITDLFPSTGYRIHPYAIYKNKIYELEIKNDKDWMDTKSPKITAQYESTQTSITINNISVNCTEPINFEIGLCKGYADITDDLATFNNTPLVYNKKCPNTQYKFFIKANYDDYHFYSENVYIKTLPTAPEIKSTTYATSLNLTGEYNLGDATLKRCYFEGYEDEGNNIVITGLKPQSTHNFTFVIETNEGSTEKVAKTLTTDELCFESLTPKVTDKNSAIVSAKVNIANEETNSGFEWRKTDAPEVVQSKSGYGVVYDGILEGRINNLNADSYYKARPFYKDNEGNYYYGEWIGFDPSDFSYFEPTVHTYAKAIVQETSARVKGVALQGTDDITEQGFEYWTADAMTNRAYGEKSMILATGQSMEAEITDLTPNTTYNYRAFAKTAKGMTYGETQQFATPSVNGIQNVYATTTERISYDIRGNRDIEVLINNSQSTKCQYSIISISGKTIARGSIVADNEWHRICDNSLPSGLYIITVIDNTNRESKKLYIK